MAKSKKKDESDNTGYVLFIEKGDKKFFYYSLTSLGRPRFTRDGMWICENPHELKDMIEKLEPLMKLYFPDNKLHAGVVKTPIES